MLTTVTTASIPDIESFTKLVLAADWACYTAPADRADLDRLRAVIAAFPQGFRLYMRDGQPVGYTGWYPVSSDIFDRLHDAPHSLTHRGQIRPHPGGAHLYLFNYSIIPALHKTAHSRRLIKDFAAAVQITPHRGLAAVTVSPDGGRIAEQFGMSYRGDMTHDGVSEKVFACRL